MPDYRVYCIGVDKKITSASCIAANDPSDAAEQVSAKFKGTPCEIWEGATCVAKVPR